MIASVFRKYKKWKHKRDIWSKYGNRTKCHLVGEQFAIGDYTYGVPTVHMYDDRTKLTIGKFCSLAAGIEIILGGNHHIEWTSTYAFYQEQDTFPSWQGINNNSKHRGDIEIGNDVWIGRNALILSGAKIGDGAVIGAGAVVAGNIPPYSIAIGNPVHVIKSRVTPPQCESLLKIRWWDWNVEKINKYLPLICSDDIQKFIDAVEQDDCGKE